MQYTTYFDQAVEWFGFERACKIADDCCTGHMFRGISLDEKLCPHNCFVCWMAPYRGEPYNYKWGLGRREN